MMSRPFFLLAAIVSGLVLSISVTAQDRPPENPGPNANIERWAAGMLMFRDLGTQQVNGWERFRLSVHPDGTRTMMAWNDSLLRNNHLHAVMRVAENFRPIEVFVNAWIRDYGYKGSTRVMVDGNQLTTSTWGPAGAVEQTLKVPDRFSIITHAEVLNGWNAWGDDFNENSEFSRFAYDLAPPRSAAPYLGTVRQGRVKFIGEERIEVPAGTFETLHFQSGELEIWATKQDRILILQRYPPLGSEYILTQFTSGP